jgi:hypothetical protein
MKRLLTIALCGYERVTGILDAVAHILVSDLVEKRIDEERASNDIEPEVPKQDRVIERDEVAAFDDCTNQPEHRCEHLCSRFKFVKKGGPKDGNSGKNGIRNGSDCKGDILV